MNCERLREEIQARLDERGAAPPLPAEAQAHLGACAECAAYAREVEGVSALLREAPEEEPPSGFAEGVMARLRADAPAPAPIRRFRPLPLRVAASLAALGIGGFVTWRALFSEDPLEQTVARATEGAEHARPLEPKERAVRLLEDEGNAEPGAAKPLGELGYLEGDRKREGEERSDDFDGAKRDQRRPPAAVAPRSLAATKAVNETVPPAPAPETAGVGGRVDGQVARSEEEAPGRKRAGGEALDEVSQAKDDVAPPADIAGGAPIACLYYSIQIGDAEGAKQVAQFAAGYYLSGADAASLRSRLEKDVFAKDLRASAPPAESPGWGEPGARPQVLSCAVEPEQVEQFDEVLRSIPGVSVWRGPELERIDPAPGVAPRTNAATAERETGELERVVDRLAEARSARAGVGLERARTKSGKLPDAGEPAATKLVPLAAPAGPSAPGPATPGPASRSATAPARSWVPIRLYLLPAPASQPASGPKR